MTEGDIIEVYWKNGKGSDRRVLFWNEEKKALCYDGGKIEVEVEHLITNNFKFKKVGNIKDYD